jgi:DNA-binding MarR family transcriptional regulator
MDIDSLLLRLGVTPRATLSEVHTKRQRERAISHGKAPAFAHQPAECPGVSDDPTPTTHLGRLLRDAGEAWHQRVREAQRAAGLEPSRARFDPILAHVGERPEPVLELFERSGLTRRGFAELVEELERLNVVERFDGPDDPRVKHLRYTPLGLDLYRRSRDVMFALDRDIAADMGPERFDRLTEALEAFIASRPPRP